ncbi:MAG: alpha-amylase family glycosyl hydrolase, partial [Bacillota bacterium]
MSQTTDVRLRNMMIYQVYVRNYSKAGTFDAVKEDLDRIKALGTDIVYLLPIHPIGEVDRKGKLGSPYSIKDYYKINDELGTLEDFQALIDAVHDKDMKLMMDIVFNHTSYDSRLLKDHPEYFYRNAKGEFSNRVGDWWDITDFDYTKNKDLWTYLIDNLCYYTNMGVDGFRFDVASFLPLDFLKKAHEAVKAINQNTIWLTESVHGPFLKMFRDQGFEGLSEGELFQVFDMAYDYDTHGAFEKYLLKEGPLEDYLDWIMRQEEIYPKNYIKCRNLENHDFGRIAKFLNGDDKLLKNWHAFSFFNKGATMIFNGGEFSDAKHPDLFNKDVINRSGTDLSKFIKTCRTIVDDPIFYQGAYSVSKAEDKDVIIASYTLDKQNRIGIFNVSNATGSVNIGVED